MQDWLWYHIWWWRIPVVNITLYSAAMIHFSLGLWALYQRRHFRYTAAEITQLVLGLSIPLWLASHFGAQRVSGWLYDWPPSSYAAPLFGYWVLRQHMIAVQMILMTVAWTHACIGLYFWLRMKPFFRWAAPILLSIAVLLPPLAMLGVHQGAQEVIRRAKDPAWRAQNIKPIPRDKRRDHRQHYALLFPDRLRGGDPAGVRGTRGALAQRAPARNDCGVVSGPPGARSERAKRSRSKPAQQRSACERLRRPCPLLHLPR